MQSPIQLYYQHCTLKTVSRTSLGSGRLNALRRKAIAWVVSLMHR